jgi:RNA polymerase sigma-70 factor (ECF subfamily)
VLDVPTGTVKSRCARGRARLLPLLTHLRPESAGGGEERGEGRNRTRGTSVPPAAGPPTAGPRDTGPSDSAAVKGGGGRA